MVDVLHGVEPEAVDSHLHPFVGGLGHRLEGARPLAFGGLAVVEIGEPVGPEMRVVHQGLAELYVGGVERSRVHMQGEGLAEGDDVGAAGGAVLGAVVPGVGRGADKEAPVGVEVESERVGAGFGAFVEAQAFVVAVVEISAVVGAVGVRLVGSGVGLGHGHRGCRLVGPVEGEGEPSGRSGA